MPAILAVYYMLSIVCWLKNQLCSISVLPDSVQSIESTRRACRLTQATALYRRPWPHSLTSRWLVQPCIDPGTERSGRMQADQFPYGWDKNSSQGHASVSSSGYNSTFRQCSFFLLRPEHNTDMSTVIYTVTD